MSKKIIKKILKWTGITILVLIILMILVPIIFKDEIKEMVVAEVNKNLNAELKVGDFDLTFISTFPNVTFKLYDTKLIGKDKFKGVELVNMKELVAHVGLWSVIGGDQVEIDEIHIKDPIIDVRVLEDGSANYDIVKPDSVKTKEEKEEPSNFKLSLKEYSCTNAKIKYDDRYSDIYMELHNLTHKGKGDLTSEKVDFETVTNIDYVTYIMEGITYLSKVKTDATVNMKMAFTDKSSKFTLDKNEIALNKVKFSVNGYYEMFEGYDDMELKLNASKATFKDFLSLVPAFYHTGYEKMIANGSMSLNGLIKGKLDDKNLPSWDFGLKVNNASIQYPGLQKISKINMNAASKFPGGSNTNAMIIDVPVFHAEMGPNKMDANLLMKNLEVDPYIKSGILANMNLSTIKDFMPLAAGESYSGLLNADVNLEGNMSDLENENYDKFRAEGLIDIQGMKYTSADFKDPVLINSLKLLFAPEALNLQSLDAKMGNSDFKMNGELSNYMGYAIYGDDPTKDHTLHGDFTFTSNQIDLDEIMGSDSATEESTTTSEESSEPFLVPADIDFKMNSDIGVLKYNGLDFKDVKGQVAVKDEVAHLNDMSMKAMGGTVGASGYYDTQDHNNPKVDFKYSLKEIDIQELATNFLTVEKLAPITKYATGKISSDMSFASSLDKGMMPILSSLTSNGFLKSNSISIKNVDLLKKVESISKLNNLSNQTLKNFYTKFSVNDGKVAVEPFDIKLGKINSNVSGYTSLDKKMDYLMNMDVPKEELPKAIIDEVDGLLKKANALVPFVKVSELPAIIPVKVNMTGDVTNPKITCDIKEAIMNALGVQGNIIDDIKNTIKDSVTTIINNAVDDVEDDINAAKEEQKRKILEEAQKQADAAKAAAKKSADAIRAEAQKQADNLIKEAGGNPIKKKTAEIAGKKLIEEAEKKAQAVEKEGNKKADDIMKKAQEKADSL